MEKQEKTEEEKVEKINGATKEMSSMERELRAIRSVNCALDKLDDHVCKLRVLDFVQASIRDQSVSMLSKQHQDVINQAKAHFHDAGAGLRSPAINGIDERY